MNPTTFHFNPGDAFVAYSLPGESDYFLMTSINEKDPVLSPDDLKDEGFIFHPFIPSEVSPPIFLKAKAIMKNPVFSFKAGSGDIPETISKEHFLRLANQFIRASSGEYLKLVLSRIKTIKNGEMELYELFLALHEKYDQAFVYLFNHPLTGCWMGATPEMLLRSDQGVMKTIALAGTKLYDPSEINGYWSPKDRMEQDIVVQYLENTLKAHHLKYAMKGPEDQRAGHLVHLKTSFSFELPEDIFGLIHHLHPTPAVCGIPKNKSLEYIAEHEKHDRLYYAGFLGPVHHEQKLDLFVNLRCMHIFNEAFVLYAGSGIIPDSFAEGEWEETERKFRTMQDIIEWIQNKNN